jgi:curved DNA-binding protein CbpA
LPSKTLYDLLCVRPDDDAETLQSAFRNAAKANHPDLNPGDPDAPRRFRQIVTAYEILRDAEQRGAYDRLLALERAQRRAKLTRAIVSGAAAIVAFAVVLIGGYTLFGHVSKTSVEVAEVAARKPADIIAIQPAIRAETANRVQPSERLLEAPEGVTVPSAVASSVNSDSPPAAANGRPAEIHVAKLAADTSHRGEPSGKSARGELADIPVVPEAKSNEPLIIANGGPAPEPTGSNSEVAKAVDAFDARVDRGDTGNGADDHEANKSNPIDRNRVLSIEPQYSSSEKDTSLAKLPSTNLAIFEGKKHHVRTTGKQPVLAKGPATDRASVRQAAAAESRYMQRVALESGNTSACTGSCLNRAPPLFGVGF